MDHQGPVDISKEAVVSAGKNGDNINSLKDLHDSNGNGVGSDSVGNSEVGGSGNVDVSGNMGNHLTGGNVNGNESSFELWNQELLKEKRNSIFNQPNSHVLNDRQIQEALSPFFSGVDVTHLPMTNPPIFQSSIGHYDEPIRRRRISISNGQIGQLGEDLETVENLYESQVPPMPQITYQQQQQQQQQHQQQQQQQQQQHQQQQHQHQQFSASNMNHSEVSDTQQVPPISSSSIPLLQNPTSPVPMVRNNSSSNDSPDPGTSSWKRTRMLERNRVAAYKCRQRKKVAQLQLQKDFDVLSDENRVMKKKLNYYEKLVTKFKTFFEAHLSRCASNERDSLQIIESMLRIDSGVSEVDDSGLVVKMET